MKKCLIPILLILLLCGCNGTTAADVPEPEELRLAQADLADDPVAVIMTHSGERDSITHRAAQRYSELVEEQTGDRYKFYIYSMGELGTPLDQTYALEEGTVSMHVGTAPSEILHQLSSTALSTDIDTLLTLIDKPAVRALIDEESGEKGIHFLGLLSAEYRVLTCDRPINRMEDFAGLKIGGLYPDEAAWAPLGAEHVECAVAELPTALQQGRIQAQQDVLKTNLVEQLYQYQSHLVQTNHSIFSRALFVNEDFYAGLPEADRQIFSDTVSEVMDYVQQELDEFHTALLAELEELGVTVLDPGDDLRRQMREATYDAVVESLTAQYGEAYISTLLEALEA